VYILSQLPLFRSCCFFGRSDVRNHLIRNHNRIHGSTELSLGIESLEFCLCVRQIALCEHVICRFQPTMRQELSCRGPQLRVHCEHLADQILRVVRYCTPTLRVELEFACFDLSEEHLSVFIEERGVSTEQNIDTVLERWRDKTTRENIYEDMVYAEKTSPTTQGVFMW
jgi:hypothetical protein